MQVCNCCTLAKTSFCVLFFFFRSSLNLLFFYLFIFACLSIYNGVSFLFDLDQLQLLFYSILISNGDACLESFMLSSLKLKMFL